MRPAARTVVLGFAVVALALWVYSSRVPPEPETRNWTAIWATQPPVVSTTPGGWFEAATLQMTEDFYRADSRTWWGIFLGQTVSQIQVSATYRYGVPLTDPAWAIATRGRSAVVIAPVPAPTLPVAIDTGTLREHTQSGWARFDRQINLDELRRGMSAQLEARATDPARLSLVRDAARRTIGEFVEQWLLPQTGWQPDIFGGVKVYFADEADAYLRRQLEETP
jgi:hypothetical protein